MLHLSAIAAQWRSLAAATALTALAVGVVPLIVPEPTTPAPATATSTAGETATRPSGWNNPTWTSSDEPTTESGTEGETSVATRRANPDDTHTLDATDETAIALDSPRVGEHQERASRDHGERVNPDREHREPSKHRTRAASTPADPPPTEHAPESLTPSRPQFPVAIGSWNMLGASHTEGRGCNRCHLPDSVDRMPAAIRAIARHNLDVLGLQEFQPNQQALFSARMPQWRVYANADNAVAWNTRTFAFVSASTLTIPYFGGNARQMPLVRLKHLRTGREIALMSVHNPADVRGPARQWREAAVRAEAATANTLTADDVPVFLTGDMNDRAEFFCHITAISTLAASAGGTRDSTTCTPPARMDVDWILGSAPHVTFTGHTSDDGPDVDFSSDHPLIVATATVS